MINFENSDISNIVIHHVGNKFEGGGLTLSDGCFLPEDPDVVNLLKSYFLSAFKKDAVDLLLPQLFHQLQKIHMTAMRFQTKDPAPGLLICRLLLRVAAAGRKNGRNLFGGHDHL